MKAFLVRLMFFCVLFFAFDKLFVLVRNHSSEVEVDKRLEMILNGQMSQDVIVLGSSRGARSVLTEDLERELNLKCYNLSYPGSDVLFHEFLLKTILKFNKKPKHLILTIDEPAELQELGLITFRFERLYPLVKYEYIREEINKAGERNEIVSKIFILNQLNKSNFTMMKKHFNEFDTITKNGSMPLSFQKKNHKFEFEKSTPNYQIKSENKLKVKSFMSIVNICKKENINLILLFPPNYRVHNKFLEKRLKKLAGDKVKYLVYDTTNLAYQDSKYYFDMAHLKIDGARILTKEIAMYLKNDTIH